MSFTCQKAGWRADRVPAVTMDNHPVPFILILFSGQEREPLFFFKKCLLNEFSKHELSFYNISACLSQIMNQKKGCEMFIL